jgi:hypothetical protein
MTPMRILSTVTRSYYGHPEAIEPMFLEFTEPLIRLGHEVGHFDHISTTAQIGADACGEQFVEHVKTGGYDVVLYQTGGQDCMARAAIAEAARYAPVVAWNSDDDWQWDSYTKHVAPLFTFMVTTYPQVYDRARLAHRNLLLSQWACLDSYSDFARPKDLGFTFAGQIYSSRVDECLYLRRRAGLKVYGLGSIRVKFPLVKSRPVYRVVAQRLGWLNRAISFRQINEIWNRSRVSYTPMGASTEPSMLQIKSRAFEMGLSGTLMLCQHSPGLERYYEPERQFVAFETPEDCAEKARYYLSHERERARIATAYYERTKAEHLWEHRFEELFRQIGLGQTRMRRVA